ncbi:hypothetical protein FTV92_06025 [Escherichia coli]|nr:hypothetical protein FTV92_06025 [Escherichia coli]
MIVQCRSCHQSRAVAYLIRGKITQRCFFVLNDSHFMFKNCDIPYFLKLFLLLIHDQILLT